jgi:glycosyltransferase involved in cell wall biosynthesis
MRVGVNALLGSTEPNVRATGMSRYVVSLLRALGQANGSDELIAFVGEPLSRPGRLRFRRAPGLVRYPVARIGWEHAALPVLARAERLHVFHGTTNTLPLLLGTPSVVTIHDLAFLHYAEHVRRRRYHYLRQMVRRARRQARFVITPSEATRVDVLELLGGDPERTVAIPLGVDERFRSPPEERRGETRERYGLEEPFVLAVGTVEPRKNLVRLIEAMTLLADEYPHLLALAGPTGWLSQGVEAAISGSGISKRIRRLGFVADDDLPALYAAATAVAVPSLYEGFGLPVLEALASGAAVVTSNVSSLPEVAGDAAVLVDPTSAADIAAALRRLIDAPEFATDLRCRAVERARRFSWASTAERTLDVYRLCAENS